MNRHVALPSESVLAILRILVAGLIVCTVGSAQGRYDYHPHVGDLHSSVDPSALVSSNGFNFPDGVWNNGEGFLGSGPTRGIDRGGMGELDEGSSMVVGDVHIQQAWSPFSVQSPDTDMTSVYRLVGFLYPANLYNALSPTEQAALSGYVTQTAFEVFVPETFDSQLPTIVAVRVRPTVTGPSASDPFGRFQPQDRPITGDYSGQDFNNFPPYSDADDGLSWNASAGIIDRADADRMTALSGAASGFNIISAYIVPPDNDQHGMLTIQRTLQLTRALQF
ncbi:MAG: hypothetical protein KDB80_06050, partial [Planctomycetes bacterium]|nr:hypothetical protein [Planctomycetota bacterium]